MDELIAQGKIRAANTYSRVIKEIENLERFYEAKVLSAGSIFDPAVFKVLFGASKLPVGPDGTLEHPRGPDGTRLDGESDSSDGSWYPGRDARPDTPLDNTPNSKAEGDMKSRWVPPTSVHGNNDYPSSVLDKDGYL